jgi:hypothetical protein
MNTRRQVIRGFMGWHLWMLSNCQLSKQSSSTSLLPT